MEKQSAVIIGSGTIGLGFADVLLEKKCRLFVQYSNESKLPSLQEHFGENDDVIYIKADHRHKSELTTLFKFIYQTNVHPDVLVIAAGTAKMDSDFESLLNSIKFNEDANYRTKTDTLEAFISVFPEVDTKTKLIMVSSWVTLEWNEDQAKQLKEYGYWLSNKKTNELATKIPELYDGYFEPYVNHVVRVESPTLKNLRQSVKADSNFEIEKGDEDPRINARQALSEAGL